MFNTKTQKMERPKICLQQHEEHTFGKWTTAEGMKVRSTKKYFGSGVGEEITQHDYKNQERTCDVCGLMQVSVVEPRAYA